MSSKLPKGWIETTLGEIRFDGSISVSQEQMPGETFELYSVPAFSEGKPEIVLGDTIGSNKVLVSPGDVLLCKINPRINRAWVVGRSTEYRQIASTEWIVFSKIDGVLPDFLCYFFRQKTFRDFLAGNVSGVGGSLMRVRPSVVETHPIKLPPLAEQERIVDKLNAVLSRIQQAEKASQRAKERIKPYISSLLDAAVAGELTRDWREKQLESKRPDITDLEVSISHLLEIRRTRWEESELKRIRALGKEPKNDNWKSRYSEPIKPSIDNPPKLPDGWVWASVDQLAAPEERSITDGPFGSNLKTSHYTESGPRVVRLENIGKGVFIDEAAHISQEHYESLKRYAIYAGDLVIRALGIPAPRACKIPETLGPAIVKADCIRFKVASEYFSPDYVMWTLNSPSVQARTEEMIHGIGRPRLNLQEIKSIALPIPSFVEQKQVVREIDGRLEAANRLVEKLEQQITRADATRQLLLHEAFEGHLVPQNANDEPASMLLERLSSEKIRLEVARRETIAKRRSQSKNVKRNAMSNLLLTPDSLAAAFSRIGKKTDARLLFKEAGCSPEDVISFYDTLRITPEVRNAFEKDIRNKPLHQAELFAVDQKKPKQEGRFRLIELWLENFKNLKDYTVRFNSSYGLDVVLGWNGTGKSNLFESLVIIFRDLYDWSERNRWPEKPMNGFHLVYEIDGYIVDINWRPGQIKRPELKKKPVTQKTDDKSEFETIKRGELPLPRFVFGYYSGPTNRLAEHFFPMKQAHYERLRDAKVDDAKTLAKLLEQRRFFCAETYHAKYVLLAFSYKEDAKMNEFLENRLRILGFESALFIIRRPRWALQGSKAEDFWGARGIMRRVMERLRSYAIAPMVLEQTVSDGYRSTTEDQYYFFLPDLNSLHSFAAEYEDARSLFLALESTDFSELLHDVKIQVRVKASNKDEVAITFHQLSEGEQQLLMVLGLMRFTKSHRSLVLLDEPDTHLNPKWNVDYLKDLTSVMSDNLHEGNEQQSSQILIATHDPLVIASLLKEQVHLLKRDPESLNCYWEQPTENPRGLGFTGILTSEMFGFRSDLDNETLELLDRQVDLAGKKKLNRKEKSELEKITQQIEKLGFKSASSDPYYRAFIKGIVRRQETRARFLKPVLTSTDLDTLQRETDEILAEIEAEEGKRE